MLSLSVLSSDGPSPSLYQPTIWKISLIGLSRCMECQQFWCEYLTVSSTYLCCQGKPPLTLVTMAMLIYPLSERFLPSPKHHRQLESQGDCLRITLWPQGQAWPNVTQLVTPNDGEFHNNCTVLPHVKCGDSVVWIANDRLHTTISVLVEKWKIKTQEKSLTFMYFSYCHVKHLQSYVKFPQICSILNQ